ncbi:hypothetical protein ElP_03550 [Tautonia plasticadhaerens]|uniref:Uncharacterized protein n=1 Tax=Tautonia plasticadhaerens TaxID=2527974 RepID=A0A518GVB2_9BACT|nr:hypothetical protein ElP_03550 [Tautonia plasticadhaerens]
MRRHRPGRGDSGRIPGRPWGGHPWDGWPAATPAVRAGSAVGRGRRPRLRDGWGDLDRRARPLDATARAPGRPGSTPRWVAPGPDRSGTWGERSEASRCLPRPRTRPGQADRSIGSRADAKRPASTSRRGPPGARMPGRSITPGRASGTRRRHEARSIAPSGQGRGATPGPDGSGVRLSRCRAGGEGESDRLGQDFPIGQRRLMGQGKVAGGAIRGTVREGRASSSGVPLGMLVPAGPCVREGIADRDGRVMGVESLHQHDREAVEAGDPPALSGEPVTHEIER